MTEIALVWDVETCASVASVLRHSLMTQRFVLGAEDTIVRLAVADLEYRLAMTDRPEPASIGDVVRAGIDLTERPSVGPW